MNMSEITCGSKKLKCNFKNTFHNLRPQTRTNGCFVLKELKQMMFNKIFYAV